MFENRLDSYRNVFVNILAILPIEYKSQVFVRLSLCKYFTMYLKYVIHKLILVNKKSDNSIHFKTTSYIVFFPLNVIFLLIKSTTYFVTGPVRGSLFLFNISKIRCKILV